ncbi:hypothetical protein FB451DRAFT_1396808 [Mycena latifolia]|nr:hypothetical protein FB451DRAFT_1396808 [Mycena latifolia]
MSDNDKTQTTTADETANTGSGTTEAAKPTDPKKGFGSCSAGSCSCPAFSGPSDKPCTTCTHGFASTLTYHA